jgi:hypothetical protein
MMHKCVCAHAHWEFGLNEDHNTTLLVWQVQGDGHKKYLHYNTCLSLWLKCWVKLVSVLY